MLHKKFSNSKFSDLHTGFSDTEIIKYLSEGEIPWEKR